MIRLMGMEIITMLKELLIKEVGMKINRREKGEKNGLMVLTTKVSITEARSTDSEYSNGLMEPNIMDSGRTIKCMGQESLNGQMEGFIKASIKMIRNMGKVYIHGLMGGCMRDSGKGERNRGEQTTASAVNFNQENIKINR